MPRALKTLRYTACVATFAFALSAHAQVYMTQIIPAAGLDDFGKVRTLIYQALD